MSAFAEAMAAQKAQRVSPPVAPPVAIRGQARAAASAIRAAVGSAVNGERMDVDGNSKNRRGAQSSRGPRTHNNNSTPYAKGRPPRNPREREHDPNHNRYGAIELIDRPSESSRGLLSRMDDHAPRNAPPSGPSRPRTTRPAPEGKTTIKSINAEVKTMQRKALPKYNPDLHTPEVTKWLSARFNVANGVLDMSALQDDEFLKQQNIIAPGAPDAPPFAGTKLWQAVNTIVQREHNTPIAILSLANNGFTSLRQLQRLCWFLRDVRRIDLSGNPISDVSELKHVNTRLVNKKTNTPSARPGPYNDLVELKLAGVPFSEKLVLEKGDEGYMNAVLGIFPNLVMLDGVDLTDLKARLAAEKTGGQQPAAVPTQPATVTSQATAQPAAAMPTPAVAPAPPAPTGDEAVTAQRNEWISQFSQASGMNTTWSIMCLEKNEWNPEAAWTNFNEIRATIPSEAFV